MAVRRLSVGLHWLMLVLIVAVYACVELSEAFPKGSAARGALRTWHYMLGLTVFVLVWLRIAAALAVTVPPVRPAMPQWQRLAARTVQGALYVLMVGMPLLGWLVLSARGEPVPFFGLQLPALVDRSSAFAHLAAEVHETGAAVGYILVGLHAAAALFHHYALGDDTLRRMSLRSTP